MNSNKVPEFKNLIENEQLLNYLNSVNLTKPTQIQLTAIPMILNSANLTIQGKTGSGKTLTYLLPLIQKLKELEYSGAKIIKSCPRAIILLPTRELALQVFKEAKNISHFAKLRIRKLVGGDKGKALESALESQIDILISTPDRLLRCLKNKEISSKHLKFLILDEADQLLEPSFKKTVIEITNNFISQKVSTYLISASRPKDFSLTVSEFFPGKIFETIGQGEENILNHEVKITNMTLENDDKFIYINSFIKKHLRKNGIIFTGNKARAKKVFEILNDLNIKNLYLLHKDLEIKDRMKIVENFRKTGGHLVATDVFARGIDIPSLNYVLNFDLPSMPDYYLHRSGRVGRAGRSGEVYNFICQSDSSRMRRINEALSIQGRNDLKIKHQVKKTAILQ